MLQVVVLFDILLINIDISEFLSTILAYLSEKKKVKNMNPNFM